MVTTKSADQWFEVLDQRQVGQSANKWVIQVHGVHSSRDGFWIQVSSTDDPFATIVLHLAPTTPVDIVLQALGQHDRPVDGQQAIIDFSELNTRSSGTPATSRSSSRRPH